MAEQSAEDKLATVVEAVSWLKLAHNDTMRALEGVSDAIQELREHVADTCTKRTTICEARFDAIEKDAVVNKTKLGVVVAGVVLVIQLALSAAKDLLFPTHAP